MNVTCPQCRIINPANSPNCRGCGVPFAVVPIQRKSHLPAILICVALLIGCGFCGSMGRVFNKAADGTRSETSTQTSTQTNPAELKLLSMRGEFDDDYVTVTGEVQNLSNEKLEGVWAVISHYSANGELITSDDAPLQYTPLMPGQTSPFKSMTRRNPLMKTYKVGFKYIFGSQIDYIDGRPAKAAPPPKKKIK